MTNTVRQTSPNPLRWAVLSVVLLGECMDLIDSTVVNVAAPKISIDFHAGSTSLQWIVGGYSLAIAVLLILGGRLGDLVGRRRLFLIGAAGFTLSSLACGLSTGTGVLIAARLVQGAFSALMLPQGFGLIRESFDEDEQQKAFSIFGPVIGLSAVLGPLLGGALTDWNVFGTGWRLVFFVNIPLGVAAVIAGLRVLPADRPHRGVRLDWLGTVLVTAFAVLLVYPLIMGREYGWPAWTWLMMAGGVACLVVFAVYQRSRESRDLDPLVTTSIFGHRGYSAGFVFALLFFGGMTGTLLCSTLFLQVGQGFTPIHAALCTIPLTVGMTIGAGLSGAVLGPRFGRRTLQAGTVVGGIGWLLVVLALRGHGTVGFLGLLPGLLVAGLGIGLVVAPMFDIILASVEDRETGSASGVLNAGQQLAASVGVAVLGTVFFDAISGGDFHAGLRDALWVQTGLVVAMLMMSPLLPRTAREPAAAEVADDDQLAARV